MFVVVVGIAGLEDAESIADGETWGDDQEAAGEEFAVGVSDCVDGLPGDQHGHDGGFAGAGGKFQRDAIEQRVGFQVGVLDCLEDIATFFGLGRDFGEPDGGFDRFQLAEEGALEWEVEVSSVEEQSLRFGGDLPLGGMPPPPIGDQFPHLVDHGGEKALAFVGESFAFVEGEGFLFGSGFARFGDGGDEFRATSGWDDFLGGLPCLIQLPMFGGGLVGVIEDGVIEERIRHRGGPVCRNRRREVGSRIVALPTVVVRIDFFDWGGWE